MIKKILQVLFCSVAADIFMMIGLVLLGLTLYFRINPAEGSVVDPLVGGTWVHIFLFVTTIPALMVMLVAGDGMVGILLMFFIQTCVFWALGRIWALLFASMAKPKKRSDS